MFYNKVGIARWVVQYWQMFSPFLIFYNYFVKQVAKYGKLGKYFPYCIRHRAVKTTTVKLVTEKNSPTNWILFIQFMVGESRHFHLCPPGKTLPQIIIITSNKQGRKKSLIPPGSLFLENLFLQQEGERGWLGVVTSPIISISPFNL